MNRSRLVWFALIVVAIIGAGGVWLKAQPRTVTGQFDSVGADPAYIVVSTSTPVLFTAKITDRQLKKRSVVLLRLDSAGKPSDILGRLRDDGRNGDVTAGDSIYTIRTALNESTVGAVNFQIAARFKPGRWSEPEADDDDWDKELGPIGQTGRDRPAIRALFQALLKRLASRYTLSNPIRVTVDPFQLPPDPGEAGKLTLEGVDSDGDGVRDDVQRFIAMSHPLSERRRLALSQSAKSLQAVVLATSSQAALSAFDQGERAKDCLSFIFFDLRELTAQSNLLNGQVLNTSERFSASVLSSRLLPALGVRELPLESELRLHCDFDPDLANN